MVLLATAILSLAWVSQAPAGMIVETVLVGNPGNPDDFYTPQGSGSGGAFGGVDYIYDMATFEVTAAQYTEFLNAVAKEDTYGLYNPSMLAFAKGCAIERAGSPGSYNYSVAVHFADRPVNYVSWGDAARFCNWLQNGQPTGSQDLTTTESGSYGLNGATTAPELLNVAREPDASWVVPSEDEWYKAAYHYNDGVTDNYWLYPTGHDAHPNNGNPEGDTGNSANCRDRDYTIGSPPWRTEVGYFGLSASPYGTFDQGGNVMEWNEAVIDGRFRGSRGGCFEHTPLYMSAPYRLYYFDPTFEYYYLGFRVALVPEPATIMLLAWGSVLLVRRGRR